VSVAQQKKEPVIAVAGRSPQWRTRNRYKKPLLAQVWAIAETCTWKN